MMMDPAETGIITEKWSSLTKAKYMRMMAM